MKAIINADACVGCGLCVNMCPEVFAMKDDKAVVIATPIPSNVVDSAKEGAESCPVEAITIS